MSHVANSMLETYNSLVDPSLAGYFNNDRTRKFLVKQRLITRRGEVVPEPVYRERFARESRQEYVNDMLARAIVHKALDNERRRQVTIRRKLEEIARLEHVRHVRADRDKNKAKLFERPRDSEALQTKSNSSPSRRGLNRRKKQQPNMLVRSAEPTSTSVSYGSDHADTNRSERSGSARKSNSQPGTARSGASQSGSEAASGSNSSQKSSNSRKSVSGDRVSAQTPKNKSSHSSLRSASLESSLQQSDSEGTVKGRQPSRHSSRTLSRSRSSSSSTSSSSSASSSSKSVAEVKKVQKARDKKRALLRKLVSQKIDSKHLVNLDQAALIDYNRLLSGYGQSNARRFAPRPPEEKRTGRKRTVVRNRRGLRSDSAYRHTQRRNKSLERSGGSSARSLSIPRMPKSTERIKSLCKITLRFNGFKKTSEKERKKDDKTREFLKTVDRHTVIVEQQHCGGNTVEVFRGELYPETEFDFVSQRHRGFPFGISIYIDGTRDCRLSQCCEAKYKPGLQFGNKHFSFVRIVGGKPCYKCRMDAENPEEKDKKKNKKQKSERRPSASSDESELSPDEDDAPDEADADAPYQDEEFDQASEPLRLESPESDRQSEKANDENMDIEEVSNNELEDNEPSTQKVANGEDNESAQEKAEEGRNSEDEVQDDERPASENTDPQEVRDPTPVKSVSPSADTEFTEDEQDDSDVSSTSKAVEALHSSRTSLVNQEILDKAGFERTVEAVLKNSKPENLVINAVSELGDAEFEKLLDQVSESGAAQNYKRLTISGCEKLTAKAGQLIGANLKKFQRLETIEIANIDLADAGVKHLAEALKNHFIDCFDSESEDNTYRAFTLRKVILSSCNVGDKGVEAFGALLEMDIPIDTLHLLGCEFTISADTWSRFCSNLAKNNELQSLDISGSMLGDEKMITVLEGLMGNRALQYLGIRSNLCDGKCTEHLLKLIETHPKLRTVDFSYGNAFESDQMGLIDQALSKKAEDLDDN